MRRILLAVLALVLFALPALAGPRDDEAVAGVLAQWSAGFDNKDPEALAALYTKDAQFYGSAPPLFVGTAGVRAYFKSLPWAVFGPATFSDMKTIHVAAGVLTTAGVLTVERNVNDEKSLLSFRLTMTMQRTGNGWRIVSHHASPKS